jgi:hypothetical protein
MKTAFTVFFLGLTISLLGQSHRIDVGSGHFKKLATAVTVLMHIEREEIDSIHQYLLDSNSVNKDSLRTNVDSVGSIHHYLQGHHPTATIDYQSDSIWYERTYYFNSDSLIQYRIQVFIRLQELDNRIYVSALCFRYGNAIIHRDELIKSIQNLPEDEPPPPPPPPRL